MILNRALFKSGKRTTCPKKAKTVDAAQYSASGLLTCEFSQITQPGLYVENRSGALVRVSDDAVKSNRSPVLSIREPWIVTRISDDPLLPIAKARLVAADLDLAIRF